MYFRCGATRCCHSPSQLYLLAVVGHSVGLFVESFKSSLGAMWTYYTFTVDVLHIIMYVTERPTFNNGLLSVQYNIFV